MFHIQVKAQLSSSFMKNYTIEVFERMEVEIHKLTVALDKAG